MAEPERRTLGELRDEQVAAAFEAGRAAERADVFAHVRAYAARYGRDPAFQMAARLLKQFAAELERCEHVGKAEASGG